MPIYEFRCLACQELFEILVIGDQKDDETRCPHCGAAHFERVMSAASHQIRSGGGAGPTVQHRNCPSGNCSTVTLPGPD